MYFSENWICNLSAIARRRSSLPALWEKIVRKKLSCKNPVLDFNSIEGKHAVTGLIKRMTIKNATLSDAMQIKAPLMSCFKDIVEEKIEPKNIVENINKVLDSSLNEWAEKSFDI